MKKILALILIAVLAFALASCKKEPEKCAECIDYDYDGYCDTCGSEVPIINGGGGGISTPIIPVPMD